MPLIPAPSAALVVVPYYNKPTQEGHVSPTSRDRRGLRSADHPLQRARPNRVKHAPETTLRLAESADGSSAIKEASGARPGERDRLRRPADFTMLSGDDSLTLPMMSVGGHGVISVV